MFVKICGITRPADAVAAVGAGADAIGLNFVLTSRRSIDVDAARAVLSVVPGHVMTVGIFSDHPIDQILEITSALGLAAAQLHGDDPPEVTAAVAAHVSTVIKVVAVGSASIRSIDEHPADIVMLDAATPGGGVPFDWDSVGDLSARCRVLLAGGLHPDNVAEAINRVHPWGRRCGVRRRGQAGREGPRRGRSLRGRGSFGSSATDQRVTRFTSRPHLPLNGTEHRPDRTAAERCRW